MSARWLYFGCPRGEIGHYLCTESGSKLHAYGSHPDAWLRKMCWDGNLAPQPEPASDDKIYVAAVSRLGGWGYSALSWWDRSADKRSASNSTVLAPSLTIAEDDFLAEAVRRFPWVFERLPRPIRILSGERG